MSSKGAKTMIGVLLAAFSGAVIGLFILIGLIFLIPTDASNTNSGSNGSTNQVINSIVENKADESNVSESQLTVGEETKVPIEVETSNPEPKTTFTPIPLPTPQPKPTKTPVINSPTPSGNKTPKTLPKPSPKKPVPTPSVHT
jgi:outer membrane biosynthesis protein TonB